MAMSVVHFALFACLCTGCRNYSANSNFERLAGTDDVGTSQLALSMSPDGKYLLMLTVGKPSEGAPSTWIHGVQTLEITSGAITKHLSPPDVDTEDLSALRILRSIGLVDSFAEDGWRDGRFYVRHTPRVVIDPTQVYFDLARVDPGGGMRSSDCIERETLAQFEENARKNGTLMDAPLLAIRTASGGERGMFTAPAGEFAKTPVIYYCGYNNPGNVYKCDVASSEVVFRNKPCSLLANPTLEMIKVSPDGRFLAAVYRKKLGLPVPSPGGAYELSLTELFGAKRTRYWSAEYFGSCVWDPTSGVLYFVSTASGLGVYRLCVSAAF